MKLRRGSTSVRRLIFIADSSSTTGAGLANLTHSSAGLVWNYFAGDLSNDVAVTLVAGTLGTYTSGGFVAVDNTNMPGWYEIGIPNAALDGGNEVSMQLRGATNMVPVNIYIELDAVDYQDATAFGLSRLDAAVSSRSTLDAAGVRTAVGLASANLDTQIAGIATAVWSAGTRTLSSFGSLASDVWAVATRTLTAASDSSGVTTLLSRIVGTLASGTHNPQSGDAFARLGAPTGASIAADIQTRLPTSGYTAPPSASTIAADVWSAATRTITGGTITTVSDKTGYSLSQAFPTNFAAMAITAGGAVTAGTVSDKTGYSLATAPPTATAIASQVRTELTTELGRIDVATSSRLASASYTAPDNASVTAIKAVSDKIDSTLVLDGSVYQFTVNALENAASTEASIAVLPGYITQQKAAQLNELIVPLLSQAQQSLTCYNTDGTAQSLSGKTLQFVVSMEDETAETGQTVIDTIANSGITVSGVSSNIATFRYTADMVAVPRRLIWSLRDVTSTNNVELQGGTLNVRVAASTVG